LREVASEDPKGMELPQDIQKKFAEAKIAFDHPKKESVVMSNDQVAILTHKQNVRYDANDKSNLEEVFKLKGKDAKGKKLTRSGYLQSWVEAEVPLQIMIDNIPYLVTAGEYDHPNTGKPRIGYYKRPLIGKDIAAENRHWMNDEPITQDDMTKLPGLSSILKDYIKNNVVQGTIKVPCLVIEPQDFREEDQNEYVRGGMRPK
jgi:hypothetical protein